MLRHVVSFLALSVLAGCAADPAKDVAPAEVHDASSAPAAPAAVPADAKTLTFVAGSAIEMVGSKVTGSHDISLPVSQGTVKVAAGSVVATDVTFDMAALTSDHPKFEKHLKNDDFFATDKFPTSRFVASNVVARAGAEAGTPNVDVTGTLTIRDVSHDVTIPAQIAVSETGTQVTAEFSINRQNWGVSYPGKPDNLIRDDVVVRFDLTAQ